MTKETFESIVLILILAMTIKNLFYFWGIWKICKDAEKDLKLINEKKKLLYERKAYKNLAETLTKEE